MSDTRTVEGADQVQTPAETDDKAPEAVWAELAAEEADQGKDPPADKVDEPGKAAEEDPKVEAPATEPPASQATDDLWKDAPPALREAYERERTRAGAAETLAKRHSGRLSIADRELNALRAKAESTGKATKEGDEADDLDERLKQLETEYPDSSKPVIEKMARLEAEIREIKGAQTAQAEAQTEDLLGEQIAILEGAHPDWTTAIKDNPAFVEWATKQPEYLRQTVRANAKQIVDGASVADVIDRFKAATAGVVTGEGPAELERKRQEERRKEQLEANRAVDLKKPATTAAGADTAEGIWAEFAEKDRRQASTQRR